MLARLGQPLQLALLVDVDKDVLMKRLTGRRNCSKADCGAIYNVYFSPSKAGNKCEKCGAALSHRSDDNEDTVGKRLKVYEEQTAPLVTYYKAQGKLRTVRGVGAMGAIFKNMCDIIETQIRPLAAVMGRIDAVAAARERAAAKAKAAAKAVAKAKEAASRKAAKAPAKTKVAPRTKPAAKQAVKLAPRKPARAPAKPKAAPRARPAAKKKVVRLAPRKPARGAKKAARPKAKKGK
jgi:adenylate kinase